MHSDPIADYLTRIRNAVLTKKAKVVCSHSRIKEDLSKVLKEAGFILDYKVNKNTRNFKELEINLDPHEKFSFKRVSKPGRRIYAKSKNMPVVLSGYGIAVISTPQGLMTNKVAKKLKLGGEIICEVY